MMTSFLLAEIAKIVPDTTAHPDIALSHTSYPWPAITILIVDAVILTLLVIGLIRLVKLLGSAPKEQKLLRMELGKLAEEVHQIRNELKVDDKQQS